MYICTDQLGTENFAAAMASARSVRSDSSASVCPALHAWGESEFVLKRLCEKDLLVLSGGKLSRASLIANRELLIPLVNLVGNLSHMYMLRDLWCV